MHWDGTSWSQVNYPSPSTKGAFEMLQGVSARAANDVWFAGYQSDANGNVSGGGQPILAHWDGHQWKNAPQAQAVTGQLNAIASVGGQIWGVGTSVVGLQEVQNPLIEANC